MGLSSAVRLQHLADAMVGGVALRPLTVFRLGEARRAAVLRHLLALDADDRYLRFGHAADDGAVASYAGSLDFERDIVLSAGDAARGFIVGMAHVALHPPHAEFGLSVLPQWRRRGIGKILFIEAMQAARAMGMRSVACLTGNHSVLNMARDEGFIRHLAYGEPRAVLLME